MSVSKRVFKNSSILLITNIIGRIAAAVVGIIVARKLGSSELGKLAYASSIITILDSISTFGLNTFTVRQIPKIEKSKVNAYQSSIFYLRLLINLIFTIGFFIYTITYIQDPTIRALFNILNISSLINVYSSHYVMILRVTEDMRYEGFFKVLDSVFYGLIGIILVLQGYGVVALVYTILVIAIIKTILCYFIIHNKTEYRIVMNIDRKTWMPILRGSLPFALITIIGIVYYRIDNVLIEAILGVSFVGLYSASYKIMETLRAIPEIISSTVFPPISKNLAESSILVEKSTNQILKWLNIIAFPLAVGGTLLAGKGIQLLYGDKFAASIPVLQILLWALIPLFNSGITSVIINASKNPKVNLYLGLINLFVNLGVNLLLIPKIGIRGAAIATVCNETVGFLIGLAYINRNIFRISLSKEIIKISLASIGMGLSIYLFKFNLWLLPIYILIYFALVLSLHLYTNEDQLILKKIFPFLKFNEKVVS